MCPTVRTQWTTPLKVQYKVAHTMNLSDDLPIPEPDYSDEDDEQVTRITFKAENSDDPDDKEDDKEEIKERRLRNSIKSRLSHVLNPASRASWNGTAGMSGWTATYLVIHSHML